MRATLAAAIAALVLGSGLQANFAQADELSYSYDSQSAARRSFANETPAMQMQPVAAMPAATPDAPIQRIRSMPTRSSESFQPSVIENDKKPENVLRSGLPEPALFTPNVGNAPARASSPPSAANSAPQATAAAPKKANWPAPATQATYNTPAAQPATSSVVQASAEIQRPSDVVAARQQYAQQVAQQHATQQPQRSNRQMAQQTSAYEATSSRQDNLQQPLSQWVPSPEAIGAGAPVQGYNGFECPSCNGACGGSCGSTCGGSCGCACSDSCGSSCDSCCACDSCNNCFSGVNLCGCCGPFGGVEYLLLRPTFSENQAYLARTTTATEERIVTTDNVVHADFGYNSAVRTYLGYRFNCNEEIRFTYWNYGANAHNESPRSSADGLKLFAGQLELTARPGERLVVDNGLDMNVYDIEYTKCCCNPCNSGDCCPPWTLKYSAGVRIADVSRQDNTFLLNRNDANVQAGFISADFIGAGPRVGLEGRRFFGDGYISLFAKTNLSLLLGQYDVTETRKTPPSNPDLTENYIDSLNRIIPVAEIELGGSWQFSDNITLSAGYLFQAWWDLGHFEQIEGNVFLNPLDDSNIMSFDGLFARLEICF